VVTKKVLCMSQLLAFGLAEALVLHCTIGVERAVVTSAIVIEVDVRLQTSTSGEVLSHLRTESNLLNAICSTLWVDVHHGDVVATIGVSHHSRCYLLGTALARSTNLLGSLCRLRSLDAALADEVLQKVRNALVLGNLAAKITMSSCNALVTLAARDVDVGQFASGFVASDPGFTLCWCKCESCADFLDDLFL
jgi:hypothetical protein